MRSRRKLIHTLLECDGKHIASGFRRRASDKEDNRLHYPLEEEEEEEEDVTMRLSRYWSVDLEGKRRRIYK